MQTIHEPPEIYSEGSMGGVVTGNLKQFLISCVPFLVLMGWIVFATQPESSAFPPVQSRNGHPD